MLIKAWHSHCWANNLRVGRVKAVRGRRMLVAIRRRKVGSLALQVVDSLIV